MTRSRALAPEPRHHTGGGATGAGRGQWVKYPLRLVLDAEAYADADSKVYGKVKALSKDRPCVASVIRLSEFTGLGRSTVEKSLGRLSRPAPTDGVQELTRRQRSHKGTGTGRTTERTCRELEDGERHVCAPVRAADTLRGLLHRLYLLLRYTIFVERRQMSLAEIGAVLRHHGGESAGEPLHEATAGRLLDELEDTGWITQDKRAGYRGRHTITVHDDPIRPACEPDTTPPGPGTRGPSSPDAEGGVAPDADGGALAYKEDLELNDLGRSTDRRGSSAVGDLTVSARPPVDTAGNGAGCNYPVAPTVPAWLRSPVRPPARPAHARPHLTLNRHVWAVLTPVADLLPAVSDWAMRRIAREIARQLGDGIWAADIRDQITRLRQWTPAEEIRDPGRWLLGAVLPVRSKCGRPGCHFGFLAYTGMPCKACAEAEAERPRSAHPPHTGTWHECTQCQKPARQRLPGGLCRTCA